jgi:hypothetical protein
MVTPNLGFEFEKKIPDSKEGILGWCPGPLFVFSFE